MKSTWPSVTWPTQVRHYVTASPAVPYGTSSMETVPNLIPNGVETSRPSDHSTRQLYEEGGMKMKRRFKANIDHLIFSIIALQKTISSKSVKARLPLGRRPNGFGGIALHGRYALFDPIRVALPPAVGFAALHKALSLKHQMMEMILI